MADRSSTFHLDEHGVYRCAPLEEFAWLGHGFGTKASEGWLAGRHVADLQQVHSDGIIVANRAGARQCDGDALMCSKPGLWLAIRTADCVPVLLVDERQRLVAAAHCGWRGTVMRLAPKVVERMKSEFGSRSADLHAALGPGIGVCCFEVGREVAREFRADFPERMDLEERTTVNLAEALARQLLGAGVSLERIYRANLCTVCEREQFHSFRRDQERGLRMESALAVLE